MSLVLDQWLLHLELYVVRNVGEILIALGQEGLFLLDDSAVDTGLAHTLYLQA